MNENLRRLIRNSFTSFILVENLHRRAAFFRTFTESDVIHGAEQCSLAFNFALREVEIAQSSSQPVGAISETGGFS